MISGVSHHVPEARCLNCGQELDAASAVGEDKKPKPGAIVICAYCSHIQALGDDWKMRPLTDEEIVEIAGASETLEAIQFAHWFQQWKEAKHEKSIAANDWTPPGEYRDGAIRDHCDASVRRRDAPRHRSQHHGNGGADDV